MIFKVAPEHRHELRQRSEVYCDGSLNLRHTDLYVDGKRLGAITRINDIDGERFIHYDSRPIKD